MSSVLMWGATVGLLRSIAEIFGAVGGAALVFSVSALFATLALGLPRWRDLPRAYLWGGGLLFVAYEVCLALSLGYAHDRGQAMELGMINYLWPSLTIVLAVVSRQHRGSWLLLPALGLCFAGIVWVMKGQGDWSVSVMWQNVLGNPLAYGLALGAAFLWAAYSVVTRRFGKGKNAVPLFLLATSLLLWIQYAISAEPALPINLGGIGQVLLLGALTSAAYSCWNHGMQHGNFTLLATASYFTPVLSALLASLWLGVRPGAGFFYGALMVTAGSLLCWWATRARRATA
ncbi:drug/metabolite DMT transporter permease [Pigmentiphaga aceris]|uniref:Drug/metabolite DMT transporter permease n=2 Tax=Pigmentiphaga aceris TaxID=1940612 RepID=A0A5C0B5R1_9BURK|nr:drug/metabolite DMT transporter permease [Pigmentiphaga aceris]